MLALLWACGTPAQGGSARAAGDAALAKTDDAAADLSRADTADAASPDASQPGDGQADAGEPVDVASAVDAGADAAAPCTPAQQLHAGSPYCGLGAPPADLASAPAWVVHAPGFDVGISVPLDGVFRLRYSVPGGATPWPSGAIVNQDSNIPTMRGRSCSGIALCTATLAVHVATDGRVRVLDAQDHVLLEDPADGGFGLDAQQHPQLVRKAGASLRFHGLGGKTGGLDRRGKVWTLRTTDAYVAALGGYDPAGDPLYQAVPWLLLREAGTTWGILTDNPWRQTLDLAATQADRWTVTADGGVLDQYVVAGPLPADVLDRSTQLTGRPFLPPRWALGYHQSRWGYPDAQTFQDLAKTFRDQQLPCDALWFDIQHMDGFRAFTWDLAKFPDPKGLNAALHAQGFHTVAIVDPGIKQDASWPVYQAGLAQGLFLGGTLPYIGQVWPGAAAFPDFTKPATRDWWAQQLVPQETQNGIDALWIDMNEPSDFNDKGTVPDTLAVDGAGQPATMAAAHNVYALRMAQATRAGLEAAHPDQRAFVLTRSGYAGIQRYAAAWTGDAPSTLAALQGTLPMLLGLGLSGEPWVGSDVGGYSGQKDPALFARWWTLGAISPFFRGHAEKSAPNQEPWQWGTEVRDLARDLLGQRYRLLPYLESLADAAHATGAPVLRPLFWEFPSEIATELIDDEALLGPFLLYAPHTQPDVKTRAVVFPPGMWLQAWSGAIVQGPTTQQVSGPLADLPLWLREGAIVPRGPLRQWAEQPVAGPLDLELVRGSLKTQFVLREDDGISAEDAPWRKTLLQLTPLTGGVQFAAAVQPGSTWQPAAQPWRLHLWRVDHEPTAVTLNGNPMTKLADGLTAAQNGWSWDANERTVTVRLDGSAWSLWPTPLQPALKVEVLYDTSWTELVPTVDVPLRVKVPAGTPPGSTISVAHSANNWQQVALAWNAATGLATGTVTVPRGAWFEYKYARGAWNSVEKWPGCAEASNRYAFGAVHALDWDHAGKDDEVWQWADLCP